METKKKEELLRPYQQPVGPYDSDTAGRVVLGMKGLLEPVVKLQIEIVELLEKISKKGGKNA